MNFGKVLLPCLLLTGVTLVIGAVLLDYAPAARAAECETADDDGRPITRCLLLDPEAATRGVGSQHTVTATVTDNGVRVSEEDIVFRVEAGPNTGEFATAASDGNGQAQFTYTGDGGPGTDIIAACLIDNSFPGADCFDFGAGPPDAPVFIEDTATSQWLPDSDGDGAPNALAPTSTGMSIAEGTVPATGVAVPGTGVAPPSGGTAGVVALVVLLTGATALAVGTFVTMRVLRRP